MKNHDHPSASENSRILPLAEIDFLKLQNVALQADNLRLQLFYLEGQKNTLLSAIATDAGIPVERLQVNLKAREISELARGIAKL